MSEASEAVDRSRVAAPERAETENKERRIISVRQQADNEALSNYRLSSSVAGLCKELALKTAIDMGGKNYVPAATMEAIAIAHGYVVSTRTVEYVPRTEHTAGGFKCMAELKNMDTGDVLATAEGFVGEDEIMWFGGVKPNVWDKKQRKYMDKTYEKRPDFAIRAMCTTRAAGRVCKLAFAHVLAMMDAKLETTPLEDVIEAEFIAEATAEPSDTGEPIYDWKDVALDVPHLKKHGPGCDAEHPHGMQLGELSSEALSWYQQKFVPAPNATEKRIRRALDISMGREQPDMRPANGEEPPA